MQWCNTRSDSLPSGNGSVNQIHQLALETNHHRTGVLPAHRKPALAQEQPMNNHHSKLTSAVLAAVALGAPTPLPAQSTAEFEALKKQIQALQQKTEELERKLSAQKTTAQSASGSTGASEGKYVQALREPVSLFKIPDWVTGIKLQNDLRLRYDGIYAPDGEFVTRQRVRPRLRLGGIVSLKDDWEIGFRIASTPSVGRDSGGDPLSTNQTFEDNGSRKPIGVDWAFARWTPIHTPEWTGSFSLGKMENPPNYSENIFDVDYTPEGF